MTGEEVTDALLVECAGEGVQIPVTRPLHGPERFWLTCLLEQCLRLVERCVRIVGPSDDEDG